MRNTLVIIIALFEGTCFISFELIAAKLAAPYYGMDVNVWATYFAFVLTGLGFGYVLGGKWSKQYNTLTLTKIYAALILLYGVNYLFLPSLFEASLLMNTTGGLMVTGAIHAIPICLLFGSISPLLIAQMESKNSQSGFVSGILFFSSTISGGLGVILFGLYIIPYFGLNAAQLFSIAILLISLGLVFLLSKNEKISSDTNH